MNIEYDGYWFRCLNSFAFKDELREAGFSYQDRDKSWVTNSFHLANKYKKYLSLEASEALSRVSLKKDLDTAIININSLLTEKPFSEQIDGVKFALSRNHSYLAFDAGVGKTGAVIMVMNYLAEMYGLELCQFLISVPQHLVSNWALEIKKYSPTKFKVQKIKTRADKFDDSCHIIVCPDSLYLNVKGKRPIVDQIKERHFTAVFVDEAHRFVNEDADRTTQMFSTQYKGGHGIVHQGEKVVLLSGTCMKKGVISLYSAVRALAWNKLNFIPYHQYGLKFCNGHQKRFGAKTIWDFTGSSNEDLFRKKIIGKFILPRELKLDVKLTKRLVALDLNKKSNKIHKLEKALELKKSVSEIIGSKQLSDVAVYRHEIGKEIVPAAAEYIKDILNNNSGPIILVAFHTEVILELQNKLKKYKPAVIYGKIRGKKFTAEEERFKSGETDVLIGQITKLIGSNYQHARRVIFVESSFAWDENEQALKRSYRKGQKENVLVEYLAIADSLHYKVLATALKKEKQKNKIMKGKNNGKSKI